MAKGKKGKKDSKKVSKISKGTTHGRPSQALVNRMRREEMGASPFRSDRAFKSLMAKLRTEQAEEAKLRKLPKNDQLAGVRGENGRSAEATV